MNEGAPRTGLRVGFIGLGAMGRRMAIRLISAGYRLSGWNRTREATEAMASAGVIAVESPAAAASRADVVITMVADPAALRDVVTGPDGIYAGLQPSGIHLDMSTVGPTVIEQLAARLPTGTSLLDAPVLGSIAEAEAGRLQILVGGTGPDYQRCLEVLNALGEPRHVGPVGSGAAAKLVANAALLATITALGECVALGDALRLDRTTTLDLLSLTPLGEQAHRRRAVLAGETGPPRFALRHALKDSRLILDSAPAAGNRASVMAAVAQWFTDAELAGHGAEDYTAVLPHITS